MFLTLQLSFLKRTYSVYSSIENMYSVIVLKALKCANRFYKNLGNILAKNPRYTFYKKSAKVSRDNDGQEMHMHREFSVTIR